MSVMTQYLLGAVLAAFLEMVLTPWLLLLAALFAVAFIAEFLREIGRMM